MDRLPVVHRQLISLNVDPGQQRLWGYTELQVSWPNLESVIGLHAYKLDLKKVLVDGQEAGFDLRPYPATVLPQALLKGNFSSAKDAATKVAEYSMHEYERLLQREEEPELTITLPKAGRLVDVTDPMRDATLRIEYSTQASTSGMHFCGDYAFTDNEVRRARAWFPCVDTPASACPFDLRITVPEGFTAVGPGELIRQTQMLDRRKTFHYRVPLDTPPSHIGIVVGPFAILPGSALPKGGGLTEGLKAEADEATPLSPERSGSSLGEAIVTHFGPVQDLAALKFSSQFLPLAFGMYESLLGAKFPYKAFQQAVLPAGQGPRKPIAAAGLQIISTDLLFTERCIEQAIEARLAVACGVAQQWFGVFLRPKAPADAWLLEGLAGWLEDQYVRLYMGRNEQAFRRFKEREAIYLADTGQAPPLYPRGESYPWGSMHGTEALDPSDLRRWKATAVIGMLEKRVGEEAFKKLLERIVFAACDTSAKDVTKRLLGTRDFLKEVGKQGGFRKDITAFHERWIAGQGCPQLTAAFTFHRKRSVLEVAIRQSGTEAARKSAERAAAAASKDASSIGIVEVQVRQDKLNPASSSEHPVNIGLNPVTLVDFKLSSRQAIKKMRKKKRGGGAAAPEDDDSADEEGLEDQDVANRLPLSWVRIDPQAELLASTRVLQPVAMWAALLEHSRDVAAQSAAVAALMGMEPFTYSVLNALQACLENSKIYCRVRVEAAMAMGLTAHKLENLPAVDKLIKFYTDRCFDQDTHLPRAHQFDNLAEHFVNQAVPLALGVVRDEKGFTPVEAADFILELLEHNDNSGNLWSDGSFLAALLNACGLLRIQSSQVLLALTEEIECYLARDAVLPSQQRIVTQAAIAALASLAADPAHRHLLAERAISMLQQKARPGNPYNVSVAALKATSRLAAAQGGLDAARESVLQLLKQEPLPMARHALLEDFWQLLRETRVSKDAPLGKPLPATLAALEQVHGLLGSGHDSPSSRHLGFMILQRLGGLPCSLFREPKEEEGFAGPTMSMETGAPRRVKPAASQATSMSGGRQTVGIKVRLKGAASMAPGPSVGGRGQRSQRTVSVSQQQQSRGTPQPPSPTSRRKSQLFGQGSQRSSPSPAPGTPAEPADMKPAVSPGPPVVQTTAFAGFQVQPQGLATTDPRLPAGATVSAPGGGPPSAPRAAAGAAVEEPAHKKIKVEPTVPPGVAQAGQIAAGTDVKAAHKKEKKRSKDREHKRRKLDGGEAKNPAHITAKAQEAVPVREAVREATPQPRQPLLPSPKAASAADSAAILQDVQRIMSGPSSKDSPGAPKAAAKAKAKKRTPTPQPARDPTPPKEDIEAAVRDAVAIASGAFRQGTPPLAQGASPLGPSSSQPVTQPPKVRKEKKSRLGSTAPPAAAAKPAVWQSRGQVALSAAAENRASPQPVLPGAAAASAQPQPHKALSIKVSLGGRSSQPKPPASQPAQVEEEPLTFFGKKAPSPAPQAAGPPAQSAGNSNIAAPARKLSIKPPRPSSASQQGAPSSAPTPKPKLAAVKGAAQSTPLRKPKSPTVPPGAELKLAQAVVSDQPPAAKAPMKLKIKLGGKAVSYADAPNPSASGSVAGSERPPPQAHTSQPSPSPPPRPNPSPKPNSATGGSGKAVLPAPQGGASIPAASSQQGHTETPEQRAERKRLEKLAKEARRKDETEEQKAARRAAKKGKKDAKKAKRDSHEASLGPSSAT